MVTRNGRPRADGKQSGAFAEDNPLYELLREGFPQFCERSLSGEGEFVTSLNIRLLSDRLDYSKQHLYRSIENRHLSPEMALKIVKVSEGAIAKEELLEFLSEKHQRLLSE